MKNVLCFTTLVLSFALSTNAQSQDESTAWKLGWPMKHGPYGNFNPAESGLELVDHLRDTRKVWESEYNDIGVGKCGLRPLSVVKSIKYPLPHQGGFSTPIVANGKVFIAHYRPSGDVRFKPEGRLAAFHANVCTVAADDVVVAIDANTGKTVWVSAQLGKGANHQMGKRDGWGVTPVYHDGRVFAVGTTGRIYALDVKTGDWLWESHVGKAHELTEVRKAEALAERKMISSPVAWDASPVVAGETLVVPSYIRHGGNNGLRGHSLTNGELKWELPGVIASTATPSLVTLDDRQFLLCATSSGELRLIDPAKGKVLWTLQGLGPNRHTLTPDRGVVVVNVRPTTSKGDYGRLAGYELSLTGAKRIWEMPDKFEYGHAWWPDNGAHRKIAQHDGKAHLMFAVRRSKSGPRIISHVTVDTATGKMLAERQGMTQPMIMPSIVESRLMFFGDLNHHPAWGKWWLLPKDFPVTEPLPVAAPFDHLLTSGYEVQLEFPIVAGRVFMRSLNGKVVCYDIRKNDSCLMPSRRRRMGRTVVTQKSRRL